MIQKDKQMARNINKFAVIMVYIFLFNDTLCHCGT